MDTVWMPGCYYQLFSCLVHGEVVKSQNRVGRGRGVGTNTKAVFAAVNIVLRTSSRGSSWAYEYAWLIAKRLVERDTNKAAS